MNRIIQHSLFLLVIIIGCGELYAQDDEDPKFVPRIEWSGYVGSLIIHREAMEDMKVTKPYLGQELRIGVQTTGKRYWEELFNYPIYGVGFYAGYFNNTIIGNPYAFFGFMEIPFVRKKQHFWSTSWGAGAGFNVNQYDEIENPENVAIGTDVNIYVDFSTVYKYRISKSFEIGGGMKFQHLSNGSYRHPNLGLNMLSGQFSIAYFPSNTPVVLHKPKPESHDKIYEFSAMYGGGYNSVSIENTTRYYNSVVSLSANKFVSFKRTVGAGVDIFYNEYLTTRDDIGEDAPTSSLMSYGVYGSTDLVADRFRMVVQLGFYMWRKVSYDIPIYERLAIRYYVTPNLFANVSIKAHGFKAQYLEWGLGVSF